MNKKVFWAAGLVTFMALVLSFQLVLAHESITVGDYEIEIGWLNEPPVAGQSNAIVVNLSNISTGQPQPVEDISLLSVTITYGGQEKRLILQPLGEDTPGQFMSPILPTIPGEYTVLLEGQLGDTLVDAHLEPEEVEPADTLQFPSVESSGQSGGMMNWLIWLSVLLGLAGVGLGITALRKTK
jgi:hypothetical protein